MEIVLMRHGRPRIDRQRRLSAAGFCRWLTDYDAAGIVAPPPSDSLEQAGRRACVVCSDLPRSTESVAALGLAAMAVREPLFRELGMPCAAWRLPRLPPAAWMVIFRLLWATGYAGGTESLGAARQRARRCALRLAELAAAHGRVLLVGHGALNWLIARQLADMGWRGPRRLPARYWAFGVYRLQSG